MRDRFVAVCLVVIGLAMMCYASGFALLALAK